MFCACGCGRTTRLITESNATKGLRRGEWRRYCKGHHHQKPVAVRFWRHFDAGDTDACWEWRGKRNVHGYGMISLTGGKSWGLAHRVSWEMHNGPIPAGMHICHKCDHRPCVNPAHLFLGTNADNVADRSRKGRSTRYQTLKTHCPRGHEYTPENTYIGTRRSGATNRNCRECHRLTEQRRRDRKAA